YMPGMPSRSGAGPSLSPKASPPDCEACPVNEKRPAKGRFPPNFLLTQPQLLDQAVVPLNVLLLEIGEQAAALVDHHQQAAARVVVLVVVLEVLGQVADALGEDRDLDFGGTGIVLGLGVVLDDFLLLFGGNRHSFYSAVSVRLNPRTTFAVPPESSISATGTLPAVAK